LAGVCLVAHRACRRAVLFQLNGYGLDWTVHTFEKPWFTTFESALACWVTLALFALANLARRCWVNPSAQCSTPHRGGWRAAARC